MGAFKLVGMSAQGRQLRWKFRVPPQPGQEASRFKGASHSCSLVLTWGGGQCGGVRSFESRRHESRVNLGFLIGKMKVITVAISQDCDITMQSS